MKSMVKSTLLIFLFGLAALPAQATFSSLYVFGDCLSATADSISPGAPSYYEQRWSNGRVWVEVLAQRQGLAFDAGKNNSYWLHTSAGLVTEINSFNAPADVANDLFIVWVCNADTFASASKAPRYNASQWQAANALSQANHLLIITNLYAKGVRTLILPNAVDISKIPAFNQDPSANVMRNGCIDYNARFSNTISQARALCPGLTIYTPDFFTLLNNVLTNAASYGLTNITSAGFSIDAIDANNFYKNLPSAAINGFGTNFIFWDPQDPTAKFHEIIADVAQQIISPVKIGKLTPLNNGSNRLDLINVPIGLNGSLDGTTNLTLPNWSSVTNITSTTSAQSIFVIAPPLAIPVVQGGSGGSGGIGDPGSGTGTNSAPFPSAAQFYRVSFPYAWNWP